MLRSLVTTHLRTAARGSPPHLRTTTILQPLSKHVGLVVSLRPFATAAAACQTARGQFGGKLLAAGPRPAAAHASSLLLVRARGIAPRRAALFVPRRPLSFMATAPRAIRALPPTRILQRGVSAAAAAAGAAPRRKRDIVFGFLSAVGLSAAATAWRTVRTAVLRFVTRNKTLLAPIFISCGLGIVVMFLYGFLSKGQKLANNLTDWARGKLTILVLAGTLSVLIILNGARNRLSMRSVHSRAFTMARTNLTAVDKLCPKHEAPVSPNGICSHSHSLLCAAVCASRR